MPLCPEFMKVADRKARYVIYKDVEFLLREVLDRPSLFFGVERCYCSWLSSAFKGFHSRLRWKVVSEE